MKKRFISPSITTRAAASKKLPFAAEHLLGVPIGSFFESPGYPLLPIKKRLLGFRLTFAFLQGVFLSASATIPAAWS